MKKVALWGAVSSLPQAKEISVVDQIKRGHEHAKKHGAKVVAELIVPGKSRNIVLFEDACAQIDAYAELKAHIEAKSIDVLVYLEPSRLGRTAALVMTVAELCTRAGILLYEIDAPPATMEFTPPDYDALLIRAIKATGAQQEVRRISNRHLTGMIARVDKGLFSGKPNFGYKAVYNTDGDFVEYAIDQQAMDAVLLMFSLYLEGGYGCETIADHLNRLGYESPKIGVWSESAVRHIIERVEVYAGKLELNRESPTGRPHTVGKGIWPAVITEQRAKAILAEIESRKGVSRSLWHPYRFSRMIFCNVCGEPMGATTSYDYYTKNDGSVSRYDRVRYRCRGRHAHISEYRVMMVMCDQIEALQDIAYREKLIKRAASVDPTSLLQQIAAHNAHIDRLRAAIEKADKDLYIHDRLTPERHQTLVGSITADIAAAQGEIAKLNAKIEALTDIAQRGQRIATIHQNGMAHLNDPDIRASNAWLRQHFKLWAEGNEIVAVEIL